MKYSRFSNILKQLRTANNMTQDDLAAALHVSRSTIAGYEARNNQPDFDKLVQLADIFHVSVSFLLTGELESNDDNFSNALSDKKMEELLIDTFQKLSYEKKWHLLEYGEFLKYKSNIQND